MSWIIGIFVALLLMMVFAILMDFVTWIYEIAWIFPVIIGVVILIRFIVRPDFREKVFSLIIGKKHRRVSTRKASNSSVNIERSHAIDSLKELVDVAFVDGEISEAEKRTIVRKAVEMGLNPDEAESFINLRVNELKKYK